MKLFHAIAISVVAANLYGCADNSDMSGTASKSRTEPKGRLDAGTKATTAAQQAQQAPATTAEPGLKIDGSLETASGSMSFAICGDKVAVPGTANPFLAGVPVGQQIKYSEGSADVAGQQSPTLVSPKSPLCFAAGSKIIIEVNGSTSNAAAKTGATGDGVRDIAIHQKGAYFGKSNVAAPLSSLVAVFLDDSDPSSLPAPAMLEYRNVSSKNYSETQPLMRQIFFVGDGLTDDKKFQLIVVPAGATRLFLGTMDGWEWSNNTGSLDARLLWANPKTGA